jgi:phosphatidylglycerophosphatase C
MKIGNVQDVVFFDLDGTIIDGQSQQYLIKFLFRKKEVNFFDFMVIMVWFIGYKFNFINDPLDIMRVAFKRILKGKNADVVDEILSDFYNEELSAKIKKKIRVEIKKHKKNGARLILMTNAIEPLALIVAKNLGLGEVIATKLKKRENNYTGTIDGIIVYGKQKGVLANKVIKEKTNKGIIWAYADHRDDVSLFDIVDHIVLVEPNIKTMNFYKKRYKNKKFFNIIQK